MSVNMILSTFVNHQIWENHGKDPFRTNPFSSSPVSPSASKRNLVICSSPSSMVKEVHKKVSSSILLQRRPSPKQASTTPDVRGDGDGNREVRSLDTLGSKPQNPRKLPPEIWRSLTTTESLTSEPITSSMKVEQSIYKYSNHYVQAVMQSWSVMHSSHCQLRQEGPQRNPQ